MQEGRLSEWGVKKCPLVNRQCMEKECAWWVEGEKKCSVLKIAINQKDVSDK